MMIIIIIIINVCMYVCIYVCVYVYMYVCMYVGISKVLCSASYSFLQFIILIIISGRFVCICKYFFFFWPCTNCSDMYWYWMYMYICSLLSVLFVCLFICLFVFCLFLFVCLFVLFALVFIMFGEHFHESAWKGFSRDLLTSLLLSKNAVHRT